MALTQVLETECPRCGRRLKLTIYCHHKTQLYERECRCNTLWKITRVVTRAKKHKLTWTRI
jgi:hypothetical protein